ncbi:regulatory P domain of subtilisin-like proprotein convertase [Hoeflea sp. IMCC20628]|uniref:S8 family serine peptidase n=1 Tax=Hoeflea sp. IMCC20628 TaxID=1620421 RepID=UPI00063BEB82|nr:S8 family serine peptidase [Hoeflea sp. IMCC20628]AKI00358.1 regulatory P domain of subtilisin-like proprotein convertase [Hoeflea sp. IMCC20628]
MMVNDPLYGVQWHFSLLGNIEAIWEDYNGAGVNVGEYDDGVDYNHADLAGNYDASLHVVDDNGNVVDPFPAQSGDAHGTACAGIIGAVGNNGEGGTGVAFGTTITGVNIFDPNSYGFVNGNFDEFLDVVSQGDSFDIMSNSWGSMPVFSQSSNLANPLSGDARLQAEYAQLAANARDGLGTVIVQAAGNDTLDSNGDGTNASRFTATIAAADESGNAQDYTNFGQSILVSAPAASVTTDITGSPGYNDGGGVDIFGRPDFADSDYTANFGGTSAATPVVSGVVALMLEANDQLGWRDVQNILAGSAVVAPSAYDAPGSGVFDQGSWFENGAENWNGGGMHFNVSYGYGLVDAFQAVRMAEVWSLFDDAQTSANEEMVTSSTYNAPGGNAAIPEDGTSLTFTMDVSSDISVEHVGFYLEFDHSYLGDLQITMTSAEGTEITVYASNFATATTFDGTWYFGIDSLLGENAFGTWTVSIADNFSSDSGSVQSAYLEVYGQTIDTDDVYHYTQEVADLVIDDAGRAVLADTNGGNDWINAAAIGDVNLAIDLLSNGNGFGRDENGFTFISIASGTVIENVVTSDGDDDIMGNGASNEIHGMRGDDEIYGLGGQDDIFGGAGNDRVFDGLGDDTVELGSGNDYVRVGGGRDSFDGGAGVDFISYYDSANGVTVNLRLDTASGSLANHDTVVNFEDVSGSRTGNDVIYGTTVTDDEGGDNFIRTYGGNDRVFDYSGDDTVELGSGDDHVRVGGGEDSFDGGTGVDFISYYDSSNGVTVNLRTDTVSGSWAENDTVVNFEDVSGSRTGNDVIYGTTVTDDEGGDNFIRTYGGNDRVFDYSGDDTVELGSGDDHVRVGGGEDSFDGGTGVDFISYYDSSNGVTVNLRTDTVSGSWAENDTVVNFEDVSGSRTGNDVIYGTTVTDDEGGDNFIRTYGGNDRVFDYSGDDTVELGSGDDHVRVGGGEDSFDGGTGVDFISYYDSSNGVTVNLRTDTVSGSWAENDTVVNFEDVSGSRTGNDVIYGTTVTDDEGGDNFIRTYGGNDRVFDYSGDDTVELGSGDDHVRVGGGEDSFDGGTGVDFISYYDSSNGVTVNLRTDTVSGSWAENDTVVNFEDVSGSRTGNDVIYGTTVTDDEGGDNFIRTYGGNDRVFDYSGDDTVELGSGNDYVRVGGGRDSFDGGDGVDFISYFSSSDGVRLDLAANSAALSWARDDTVMNFEGASGSSRSNDDLRGDESENVFRGNGGDDRLLGRDGNDRLYGGDDDDRLFGGSGSDELHGDDGNDFLHGGGGTGVDDLYGGLGSDQFHFDRGDGDAVVHDFENNIDVFEFDNFLGAATASNQAFFDAYASQQGSDVVFDFGADGTLTIADTTLGLVRSDFDLV